MCGGVFRDEFPLGGARVRMRGHCVSWVGDACGERTMTHAEKIVRDNARKKRLADRRVLLEALRVTQDREAFKEGIRKLHRVHGRG